MGVFALPLLRFRLPDLLPHFFLQLNRRRFRNLILLLVPGLLAGPVFAAAPGLVLDEEERQWIREHQVIRLGVDPAWPPFDFIDGQGAHSGMAADFLQLLGRRLGLSFELVPGLDWEQVLQGARERSLDLVSLSQETPERNEYLRFADPVTSVPWAVVTRRDFKKIRGLEDLSAHQVAVVKSYAIVSMVSDEHPAIDIYHVDSSLDGLRALASGQVDAMVENLAVAGYLISENNLSNLKIAADSGFDMIRLAFAVRSDWPQLHGLLNKALNSLTRDEMQAVKNRWAAVALEPVGDGDAAPEFAGWLLWTLVAVFLLLAIVSALLMRFISGERLTFLIGSTRFRTIVLVSLSVFVVLVLFLGWLAMERIEHRIRHDAGNNLENSLITTVQRIEFWAEQRKDFIRQLGRHPRLVAITEALLAEPPTRDALLASSPLRQAREFFGDEHLDLFDHLGFFIISPDYINIGSMRDANLGARSLIADRLPKVFRGEAVFVPSMPSDVPLSDSSRPPEATMFFAAPIRTADGEVIAALTLRIDPGGEFSRVLQFSRVGDSGDSYAFNRQGQLMSASRFHRHLQDVGLIGPQGRNQGSRRRSDRGLPAGGTRVRTTPDADGRQRNPTGGQPRGCAQAAANRAAQHRRLPGLPRCTGIRRLDLAR
jgi:ABC-type amino acid transport substrate-binding protein